MRRRLMVEDRSGIINEGECVNWGMKYYVPLLLLLVAGVVASAQPTTYPSSFTVAQDGSGNFRTIQEAVNAVRDLSQQQVTIHIKNGVYHEKLVIPSWKTM